MASGHTYRFNSAATDYSTCFLLEGDKVAYLADPVMPAVGTIVTIPVDDHPLRILHTKVASVRLDVSNQSGWAMVYVELER